MQNSFNAQVSQYLEFIVKNITLGSLLATVRQIARIRNRPEGVVRNEISQGRCPIPTLLDSGRRVATVLACATWLAEQDSQITPIPQAHKPKRRGRPPKVIGLTEGRAK